MAELIEEGTFWRLRSGRLIRVKKGIGRHGRLECCYVDEAGQPLMPLFKHEVTLSRDFIENYGRRLTIDSQPQPCQQLLRSELKDRNGSSRY